MTTLLLARNAIMLRALSRDIVARASTTSVLTHQPEWLLQPPRLGAARMPSIGFALLDVSDCDDDPVRLIDALTSRFPPRRWLLMTANSDPALAAQAVRRGASGFLQLPAPVERVRAAVALISAGGQCFPRQQSAWSPPHSPGSPRADLKPHSSSSSAGTTATG
jgi:DNA-binding NarL/FixJ family response regulator